MRLTTVIMIACLMQVSAAGLAQKITLNKQNVLLSSVLKDIRKQSGFDIYSDATAFPKNQKVTVVVDNATVDETLNQAFKGLNLSYKIEGNIISIKPKEVKSFIDKVVDYFTNIEVNGKVSAEDGSPLAGANVKVKGTLISTLTNDKGEFTLKNVAEDAVLEISYIGYEKKEVKAAKDLGSIAMTLSTSKLQEVNVVNTGYQSLQKERVTGSFTILDNALLNRSVGRNILERLDGVASGLVFNKNRTQNTQSEFNIRGRSTIFGEDKPLIVLDNFPFEGDINNINPNDIKNIVILRDAAAASIWGTRAGNGVVVITTHSGSFNSKPTVSFNANTTVFGKPDIYQAPWFSNGEWLEIEQFLFNKGAYNTTLNNRFGYVSEGVAIMDKRRRGLISSADSLAMINNLKGNDIRSQMLDHLYRNNFSQQYALNVNGGGERHKYVLSGGYDGNLGSRTTDYSDRITLTVNNVFKAIKNKLEISSRINFSSTETGSNSNVYSIPNSPYERIVDNNGNPLPVQKDLRFSYVDTAGNGRLLDWYYYPLSENNTTSTRKQTSYQINTGINYTFTDWLKLNLLYQHQRQNSENVAIHAQQSYYVRDLINRYSVINYSTGAVTSPIPSGEIRLNNQSYYNADFGRAQLNFDKRIAEKHSLTAMSGYEIRSARSEAASNRLYGFNPETYTNGNAGIDFTKNYPLFHNGSTGRLDAASSNSYQADRYLSYFGNLSYGYADKYILTLSARKDESNLFGVKANQKGVPLWSAGALWNIANESFYKIDWLPVLSLKASYGYSGNVSKDLSAYLTASPQTTNIYGVLYSSIINPPNPSLRWERIKIINLGVSFVTKDNRISGTIEPYLKYGLDLFGESPLTPQTGMPTYFGNTANTRTEGIDFSFATINLKSKLHWSTNLNFSVTKDKVTKYNRNQGVNSNIITQTYNNPMVGNPYFSIYGYQWAGLDNIGDPQLYLNGQISKNYSGVANGIDRTNIDYIGSTVPTIYGNIINSFRYGQFELSFNITSRLGYYFRRNSLNNGFLYAAGGFAQNIDYATRWQQAGDELLTNVPALVYPNVAQRTNAYTYANILIEKADNIRLQDVRFLLNADNINFLKHRNVRLKFYTNISNVGYLWVSNNLGLDPDVPRKDIGLVTSPTNFSIGIKADF